MATQPGTRPTAVRKPLGGCRMEDRTLYELFRAGTLATPSAWHRKRPAGTEIKTAAVDKDLLRPGIRRLLHSNSRKTPLRRPLPGCSATYWRAVIQEDPPRRRGLEVTETRRWFRVAAFGICIAAYCRPGPVTAQSVPRVTLGFGVDTLSAAWSEAAWHSSVPVIYRAWSEYLSNEPGLLRPNPRWSSAEQERWIAYDLVRGVAYHGAPATVVDIRPAPGGDEFVVRTLFARTSAGGDVRPIALTRVYALQEDGRWVFGSALPRLTADWERTRVGPIEYVMEPGRALDRGRAERLLAFADSVATSFDVPRLEALTYYVASTPERLHRAMGVDWTFGGLGYGYAAPANDLILSGDPVAGEENRHEMAHILLAPVTAMQPTHGLVNEGVATWYGGSSGRTRGELLREYAGYLAARPEIGLDVILEDNAPDRGWNVAGAILVDLVHEEGGIEAISELFGTGRSNEQLRSALSETLGMPWASILTAWRERALGDGP